MARKAAVAVKKEMPSNFCADCRDWVTSNEKHNAFASIDGERKKVTVWICPTHRAERKAA